MMKFVSGVSSGITALGSTNAPLDTSSTSGVDGDVGFVASTTLAKCVGTATFGGDPITSCVYHTGVSEGEEGREGDLRRAISRLTRVWGGTGGW